MAEGYLGKWSNQNIEATGKEPPRLPFFLRSKGNEKDKPKYKSMDRPKDKSKDKSRNLSDDIDSIMTSSLKPMSIKEMAEENKRCVEAQRITQQAELRKRDTDRTSLVEGLLFQNRRNEKGGKKVGFENKPIPVARRPVDEMADASSGTARPKWSRQKFRTEGKSREIPRHLSSEFGGLIPLTMEQQAEENLKILEAQGIIQTAEAKKLHPDCISLEEGSLRQDRINKLESERAALQTQIENFRAQLAEREEHHKQMTRQVEANNEQRMGSMEERYLLEIEHLKAVYSGELKVLKAEFNDAMNLDEERRCAMEMGHREAVAKIRTDLDAEKQALIKTHDKEVRDLFEWALGVGSAPV